jgi:hypothetical protein
MSLADRNRERERLRQEEEAALPDDVRAARAREGHLAFAREALLLHRRNAYSVRGDLLKRGLSTEAADALLSEVQGSGRRAGALTGILVLGLFLVSSGLVLWSVRAFFFAATRGGGPEANVDGARAALPWLEGSLLSFGALMVLIGGALVLSRRASAFETRV